MIPVRHLVLPIILLTLVATGCGRAGHTVASADEQRRLSAQERRMAALEERLARITGDLEARGRGAYAHGPTIGLEGSAGGSLLQTLQELQEQLAEARSINQAQRLALQHQEEQNRLADARQLETNLLIARLKKYQQSTITAQEQVVDLERRNSAITDHLRRSERNRLEIERSFYKYAGELLNLEALDAAGLDRLQEWVREAVQALMKPSQNATEEHT